MATDTHRAEAVRRRGFARSPGRAVEHVAPLREGGVQDRGELRMLELEPGEHVRSARGSSPRGHGAIRQRPEVHDRRKGDALAQVLGPF
jgi:hypothetical protein